MRIDDIAYSPHELETAIEDVSVAVNTDVYHQHAWARYAKILCKALVVATARLATTIENYNSIGKINAAQALEIRELKLKAAEAKEK